MLVNSDQCMQSGHMEELYSQPLPLVVAVDFDKGCKIMCVN